MKNKDKLIFPVLAAIVMICAGVLIVNFYLEARNQLRLARLQEKARPEPEVVQEEPEDSGIDFDEIRKENEDIVAWVEVPGTKVDYPILQSGPDMEEDFYLNHNLDGSSGYPGCIYIQKVNKADFSDGVTLVYGHNMKNGTMFKGLHEYKNRDFFDENGSFIIYTPEATKNYKIVAATTYDNRLIPAFFNNFASASDVKNFIDEIKAKKESGKNHFTDLDAVDENNHYVVLSTCTTDDNVRWLVIGVLQE